MGIPMPETAKFYLSEHPTIMNFQWSPAHAWGSTWSFLFATIAAYIAAASSLHLLLLLIRGRHPLPLGPFPALHSLAVAVASAAIFAGMILCAEAEIRDTRWFWRRTRTATPIHWLLCFPVGTRPSGRVFFWSYAFYLSRFLHLCRTFLTILRRRKLTFFQLFNQSILLVMSFLWLEFSQSFQVLAILSTTLLYAIIYGYRFWTEVGFPGASFQLVGSCQLAMLGCHVACHFGVLFLHLLGGGCNGIGAWVFNSVLNAAILLLFLKFYVARRSRKREEKENSSSSRSRRSERIEKKGS
ncbi:hypothetical protein CRG98_003134 [Punica granatum]|uniref:Elongation of fatty acids protein 3-like n=2 Tax=Punica granatum TaxID=22663 RepID=A0A2I0L742_PUNGR|nr:hypothetical protein CRG98_003134 [Punica granatum]